MLSNAVVRKRLYISNRSGSPLNTDEYIKIKEYKHLIGKRARFKNNLAGYVSGLWLKEGVIKQLHMIRKGDLEHIGLSIVFDKPTEKGIWGMDSCYIQPNSFELI